MHIQFKGTNYDLKEEMQELAERKLSALKKYLGKTDQPVLVYVDLGKNTEAHQSGTIWYADGMFDLEGKRYYAKAEAETLRTAIDKMSGELKRELSVMKKKQETRARKEGGRFKNLFRFGR